MWLLWERKEVLTNFWRENPRERVHLEVIGVGGSKILKWISKNCDEGHGMNWSVLGSEQVAGSCECINEPTCTCSIKCV